MFAINIDHKNVTTTPSHVFSRGATFGHPYAFGHSVDIRNHKGPRTWFIDFHVAALLVPPTKDIFVRQPISYPQKGFVSLRNCSLSTPL